MMEKLSKNSTQLELLREFLNLQKDMIVLMLSMLEGAPNTSNKIYITIDHWIMFRERSEWLHWETDGRRLG